MKRLLKGEGGGCRNVTASPTARGAAEGPPGPEAVAADETLRVLCLSMVLHTLSVGFHVHWVV